MAKLVDEASWKQTPMFSAV